MVKKTKKFVKTTDANETTYRVTFTCSPIDYTEITEAIQGFGKIHNEEIEVEGEI